MDDDRQIHRLSVPGAIENWFAVRTLQRLYNLLCIFDILAHRAWTQRRGDLLHDWFQCEVIHLAEWQVSELQDRTTCSVLPPLTSCRAEDCAYVRQRPSNNSPPVHET